MGEVQFRTATRNDLATIVGLLADDMLGGGREAPAEALPPVTSPPSRRSTATHATS